MIESRAEPYVSIVIPVYNEEAILHAAILELVDGLGDIGRPYEIVIAENGSTDGTTEVAAELVSRFAQVRLRHTPEPNYGKALRDGILDAKGEIIVCEEIDLCDIDFLKRALSLLETEPVDLVVGSKAMQGASDERPLLRRVGTHVINGLLRLMLGFRGTDTHGLKALRRQTLQPIAEVCLVDRDLFASELVIRAERAGLDVREIPVRVLEKRPPTVGLVRRVPNVLKNLLKLFIAIRLRG